MCSYGKYLDPYNSINPACVDCPEDTYCWNDGITQADILADNITIRGLKISGKCPSGYKCRSGASTTGMNVKYSKSPGAYMCREGYYCDNSLV